MENRAVREYILHSGLVPKSLVSFGKYIHKYDNMIDQLSQHTSYYSLR